MHFKADRVLNNRAARRNINTLLSFTASQAVAANTEVIVPSAYQNTDALFVAIGEQQNNQQELVKLLNDLIDHCMDIIQKSEQLSQAQKTRLLNQLLHNPEHPQITFSINVKQGLLLFAVLTLVCDLIAIIILANDRDPTQNDKVWSALLTGMILLSISCSCLCLVSDCDNKLPPAGITETDVVFMEWLQGVASLIEKQLMDSRPIVRAQQVLPDEEEGLELQSDDIQLWRSKCQDSIKVAF